MKTQSTWLLCLALIHLVGCACQGTDISNKTDASQETAMEHAQIEAMAHIVMPPGAQDIQTKTERGRDDAIWLRMTLPTEEVQTFLQNAGYQEGDLNTRRRRLRKSSGHGLPWWDPESLDPFLSGAYQRREKKPTDYASHVLVSQHPGPRQTLYLFVTEL